MLKEHEVSSEELPLAHRLAMMIGDSEDRGFQRDAPANYEVSSNDFGSFRV